MIRFQTIAAISVAMITVRPCSSLNGLVTFPPIVLATPVNKSAPIIFMTAARIIAVRGLNARVDTEVAIAFAVSWNPLIKSKLSASTTIMMTRIKFISM
ncbi:hypothetical protein D3C73_1194760 [compost metagenome]